MFCLKVSAPEFFVLGSHVLQRDVRRASKSLPDFRWPQSSVCVELLPGHETMHMRESPLPKKPNVAAEPSLIGNL